MDVIERNYKILEEKMIDQMQRSLNYGKELIDSELDSGLYILIRPIVKSFFKYWSDNDAKVGTMEQIKLTLNAAKELLANGGDTREHFDKIINDNFPKYLENDQTDRQCKKSHRNYDKLKEVTKKSFISQVEESLLFLKAEGEINDYDDLTRVTFKTKDKAYLALQRQLDLNEEGILIVQDDLNILKVPVGKKIIIKVLKEGFNLTKKQLIQDLNNAFN
ncbi:hypothetical protein LCGC14_0623270 [marine sediment metagenome]|uniref:Uncharacterized protein n=1 Tax=marine sediment metagenome TaxID=412755 RepID=A0A0F9R497_9ZZZZ|nr:MAG: hypothetical protein Lokiarch_03740 [Candidatus Lokiarchaeum sp. GC14_75]HEC37052.1 hypothetical protein [bacterium]